MEGHMAGITLQERKDKARIQAIEDRLLAEPDMAASAYQRLNATLSALEKRQEKRIAARAAITAARRAERAELERSAYFRANPTLPRNGREPSDDWRPTGPVTPFKIPAGINRG
jgi:hypothetical protein